MPLFALLHDVHDAEYVLQRQSIYARAVLVSTHEAVNDYLTAHDQKCESISSYVTIDEMMRFYEQAADVYELLNDLDSKFEEVLSAVIGNPKSIRYFYTLYRYLGRYEYTNILKIRTALSRLVQEHKPESVHLFLPHIAASRPSFFETDLNIYSAVFAELSCSVEVIDAPLSQVIHQRERHNLLLTFFNRWRRLLFNKLSNFSWRKMFVDKLIGNKSPWVVVEWLHNHKVGGPKKVMLLLDGLRTIQHIPGLADNLNVNSILPDHNISAKNIKGDLLPLAIHTERQDVHRVVEATAKFDVKLFLKAIVLDDFTRKFGHYVLPLLKVLDLSRQYEIVGGIWHSPPTQPSSKVLLSAYLLQIGAPLLGLQHGGNYGIQSIYPRHFDADFRWCTHYFSWGFTSIDLKETYPDIDIPCEIFPVGKGHSQQIHRPVDRSIDVLFPITNASFFHRDSLRIPPHLLANYQREILQFLDQLKEYKVVIKPFRGASYSTSAFKELVHGLKHVEIMDHLSFTECFENYEVRSVLIEYPSSPLFEAMQEQTEILALTNEIIRYSPAAEELLQRRVHLFNNFPDLEKGLREFLEGRLQKRRDNGFIEKYLIPTNHQLCREITHEIFETG